VDGTGPNLSPTPFQRNVAYAARTRALVGLDSMAERKNCSADFKLSLSVIFPSPLPYKSQMACAVDQSHWQSMHSPESES